MSDNYLTKFNLYAWITRQSEVRGDIFGHLLTAEDLREVYIQIGEQYVKDKEKHGGEIPEVLDTKGWGTLLYALAGDE